MEQTPTHIKFGLKIFGGVLLAALVFLGGVYIGYQHKSATSKVTDVINKEPPITDATASTTDFEPFWKAWQIVSSKFPGAEKIASEDRMYGAIKGMLGAFGDPYTTFFPPTENKVFETQIAGEFSGVGIEIGEKDGILTVIAPLKGTPAEKAGIKSGDKIVKIDDQITSDIDIDKAIDLIRGTNGTEVSLTIFREGFTAPKIFSMTRAKIALPTIDTETRVADKVFIIHLYSFSAQSPQLFHQAFQEYLNSGYQNLLLDLRGNPGGYLDAAVQIGSWFLPEGKVIVKEIGKTEDDITVHTSDGPDMFPKTSKLVILVDKGSASASEILAGALSEQGIGTLAGEQTFGKGSVQEVIKLTPDTSMKVTVAKWYTPNGTSISKSGLTPKVVIKQGTDSKVDTQLEAAIKLFKTL